MCERLKWAYKTAQNVIEKENKRHKWNYDHKVRWIQLGMDDLVLLRRTAFKGQHKVKDHWEDTIYHVEGKPYAGLTVFKIAPAAGEGKLKVVHQTLLLPFGGSLERGPDNEVSQQDVNRPQDCILAVLDDGVQETEVVSTDP